MRGMRTKLARAIAAEERRRGRDEKREERRRQRQHRRRARGDAASTVLPDCRVLRRGISGGQPMGGFLDEG
jgi:hypothetical protein